MSFMWEMTIDDYIEICERAKAKGLKPGDSMELIMLEYMKEKGKKPLGATDLSKEELIQEFINDDKTILSIEHDEDGEQDIRLHKKDEE